MKKTGLGISALLCVWQLSAFEVVVPHAFTANTPAKAEEVNENFGQLALHLNQLKRDFNASYSNSPAIDRAVDCTDDPYALNKAYHELHHHKHLRFTLSGECFGDFELVRNADGDLLPPEEDGFRRRYQVMGQVIHLRSLTTGPRARIVANPLTHRTQLYASFGGGLYINHLEVVPGPQDREGVLFSRNSHGDVFDTIIDGSNASNRIGVIVQEGAQAYVGGFNGGLTIRQFDTGIAAYNGTVIRGMGQIEIHDVQHGIQLNQSIMTSIAGITINAHQSGIRLYSGVFKTWEPLYTDASIALYDQSAMYATHVEAEDVTVNNGHLVADYLNALYLRLRYSSVAFINSGTVEETATIHNKSQLNAHSVTFSSVRAEEHSLFNLTQGALGALHLQHSRANVSTTTSFSMPSLSCEGLSWFNHNNTDVLQHYPNSRCLSEHDSHSLINLIRTERGLNE